MPTSPLITVVDLSQALQGEPAGGHLVIVDCRFDLAKPDWGSEAYAQSRIPGAIYLSLDADLSGTKTGSNGRHPLPSPAVFAQTLAAAGVGNDSRVVAYDQGVMMMASRLWWMLRWLGHQEVQVLDGGLAAWLAEGQPLASTPPQDLPECTFSAEVQNAMLVTADEILANLQTGQQLLIDARAAERYRGDTEPLDAAAGHIPGAVNLPFTNLLADSRLKTSAQLREIFQTSLGDCAHAAPIHSCGSGVSATVNLLAMEAAGLPSGRLYAGSWSEWSSDSNRPITRDSSSD